MESSYESLESELRTAFRRIGRMAPGDFSARTLGQLIDGGFAEQAAERLVAAGLLESSGTGPAGEPMYRPPELVAL